MALVRSITTKIGGAITLGILLTTVSLSVLYIARERREARAFKEERLDDFLSDAALAAYTVAPYLAKGDRASIDSLVSQSAKRIYCVYLAVLDKKGRLVAVSSLNTGFGLAPGHRFTPLRTKKTGQAKVAIYLKNDRRFMDISYPVKSGRDVIGSLKMGFSMAWLDEERRVSGKTMVKFLWTAAAICLFGIFLGAAVSRRITGPLMLLKEAAGNVGRGDHLSDIKVTSGDEVESLARAFGRMLDDLKSSRENLVNKDVLLKEMHHRMKNNLQALSSLIDLQMRTLNGGQMRTLNGGQMMGIRDEEVLAIFRETQNRILAMSLVHEKLYRSKDLSSVDLDEYVPDLANALMSGYEASGRVAVNMDIEKLSLPVSAATSFGLIINELMSNSLKHAFPNAKAGKIKIEISRALGALELRFSDDGVGLPEGLDPRKTKTLGLRLIASLAENQLGGSLTVKSGNGTQFFIRFENPERQQDICNRR